MVLGFQYFPDEEVTNVFQGILSSDYYNSDK